MQDLLAIRGFGGAQDTGCNPGEEFDLASMACVTAGQAATPVPKDVPSSDTPTVTLPKVPGVPAPRPPTGTTQSAGLTMEDLKIPLIIGGAALGLLALTYIAVGREQKSSYAANAHKKRKFHRCYAAAGIGTSHEKHCELRRGHTGRHKYFKYK